MFATLLESAQPKRRSRGTLAASLLVHTALIAGAVQATALQKSLGAPAAPDPMVVYVAPAPPPPPAPPAHAAAAPAAPSAPAAALLPSSVPILELPTPTAIPTGISAPDQSVRVTPDDFRRSGPGQLDRGLGSGSGNGPYSDGAYWSADVEKLARLAPGNSAPEYPSILKTAQMEGRVVVAFVVDSAGRADMSTFKVVESSHVLFTEAVRRALLKMRYLPAEIANRPVRMWVQQPFDFTIPR